MADFQQLQQQFAAHLRAPHEQCPPGNIEERRLNVYRELFYNNVKGFIEQAFPVLGEILGEERWQGEIRQFWQNHSCESPYFIHISRSFLEYLVDEREGKPDDPPFLFELAHYEWAELDISVRRHEQLDRPIPPEAVSQDLYLQLSDLAWPLHYQFPVHQIRLDYQPLEPTSHGQFLVVYRDELGEVQFLEINAVTAQLLEFVESKPGIKLNQVAAQMAELLPQYTEEQMMTAVIAVVRQLAERGILRQPVVR